MPVQVNCTQRRVSNGSVPVREKWTETWGTGDECISVALVNNMPDSALEDTETQFLELLEAASKDLPVCLKLFSLPNIPRGERGRQRLREFYFPFSNLWAGRFDAVIVTGTEPHQPDLRCEPYWSEMARILEWAEANTVSAVLSCLAAHAGVLHSDGIGRHRLNDKRFGVFESRRLHAHALTDGAGDLLHFPHSRWNEVQPGDLAECGYMILTQSAEAGVDLFVKRKQKSLFVYFQGHPEYHTLTLLKEYRRDVRRYLKRERETYPLQPNGYLGGMAREAFNRFEERALANRCEESMVFFPAHPFTETVQNTWRWSAVTLYRNWLQYVASRKIESRPIAMAESAGCPRCVRAHSATA